MPAPHKPIHQYPSAQTMRQINGPHVPAGHETIYQNQGNEAYGMDRPPTNVHDFQAHPWSPSRRPSTPKPTGSPRIIAIGGSDTNQRWRQQIPAIPRLGPQTMCIWKPVADRSPLSTVGTILDP